MIPIQLEGATQYHAPKGQEKTCGTLPVIRNGNSLVSVWTLTDLERAAIARGENVALTVLGSGHPVVALSVVNVRGQSAPGFGAPTPDPMPNVPDILDRIVRANPDKVAQARLNSDLVPWFVGQVMKATGGRGSATRIHALVKHALSTPDAAR